MEGNDRDMIADEPVSSSVEMDVLESTVPEIYGSPRKGEAETHCLYILCVFL